MSEENWIGVILIICAIASVPVLGYIDICFVVAFSLLGGTLALIDYGNSEDLGDFDGRVERRTYEEFEAEYRKRW